MKQAWMITESTKNIGDDFQCLAARQFVNKNEVVYIDRENLNNYQGEKRKIITNGWYMHNPANWPLSKQLKPLIISVHFSNHKQKNGTVPINYMLDKEGVQYLKENAPIGCRDIYTYELLKKRNIDSYFSGCMTLTIQRKELPRKDYICLVDVDDDIYNYFKNKTNRKIIRIEHERENWPKDYDARLEEGEKLLDLYTQAHCVVTTRLHAALPSMALETPVLLVRNKFGDERFTGLKELTNYCIKEELIEGKFPYDVNNPLPNPKEYLTLRKNNIYISKEFMGDNYNTVNIKAIHQENMEAVKKAIKRTENFRKMNKLKSYKYMEFLYIIRHKLRNIKNKLNR